ncbi:hypothetical protein YC2023_017898 [Brassica napus]
MSCTTCYAQSFTFSTEQSRADCLCKYAPSQNSKFHIPKTLSHPSTLNPKSRYANPMGINVFYSSLKVRKMVSVNMKSGTMNVTLRCAFPGIESSLSKDLAVALNDSESPQLHGELDEEDRG